MLTKYILEILEVLLFFFQKRSINDQKRSKTINNSNCIQLMCRAEDYVFLESRILWEMKGLTMSLIFFVLLGFSYFFNQDLTSKER